MRMHFIPNESKEITREGVEAVAYISEKNGAGYAIGYRGKATKPAFYYRFSSAERAEAYAAEFIDKEALRQAARAAAKAEEKAARVAFRTSLKVGDIVQGSWGYEQTNQEFYEVVEVSATGKSVKIREVAKAVVDGSAGYMSEQVVPMPGHYVGEEIRKPVQLGDRVPFKHCSLGKWDGRPKDQSHYA